MKSGIYYTVNLTEFEFIDEVKFDTLSGIYVPTTYDRAKLTVPTGTIHEDHIFDFLPKLLDEKYDSLFNYSVNERLIVLYEMKVNDDVNSLLYNSSLVLTGNKILMGSIKPNKEIVLCTHEIFNYTKYDYDNIELEVMKLKLDGLKCHMI